LTPDALQEELDTGRVRSAYLIAGSEALLRDAAIAALKQGAAGGPWHPHLTAIETPENPHFRRHLR
jgi:hypothetical protein